MSSNASNNIDYRLLNRMSKLVICSACLRNGKITPVAQLISAHHTLTNKCPSCRDKKASRSGHRRALGTLLSLPKT